VVSVMLACGVAMVAFCGVAAADQRVILKSGLTLQGLLADIPSLNQNPFQAGGQAGVTSRPILMVDDGLRRVYVHRRGMVAGEPQDVRDIERTIEFKQEVPLAGKPVQSFGDVLAVSDFNRYGWRTITVRGPTGEPIDVVQGITELNSRYAKVEALKSKPAFQWDMRVATRSIPAATLQRIFRQRLDQDDLDQRLRVVRFFIESERFGAAEEELIRAMRAFPELEDMEAQLVGIVQRQAMQLLDEAERRAAVGQEDYARTIYSMFPIDAVGRTTAERVRVAMEKLEQTDREVAGLIESLQRDLQQLPEKSRAKLQTIFDEIKRGLSAATLKRLSDYARLRESETVALESRVALAIAGWLMGPGSGENNLVIATSLIQIRDLVAEYLGTADAARREQILQQLKTLEGSQIEYVARLLPQLVPVKDWPEGALDEQIPGFFRVGVGRGDAEAEADVGGPKYLVQLPPEYDPLREYPTLVVLAPPTGVAEAELAWWAGDFDPSQQARVGHATRNGYIVVAPVWARAGQRRYEYTPREHDAVLSALRHAMRRASIDSDRVYIAGHGDGATAAWDIALSHPEHWAGMISIGGEPSKTIQHYSPNARTVPLYFVMGESSGPKPPLVRMGSILDDYMHVRNDATVVMYRGRGHEDFFEEIPELFKWLNAAMHVRKPIPQELETVTMRRGDQYFWWLELGPLKPLVELNPVLWEQETRKRAGKIDAMIGGGNQLRVTSVPADSFTIWLRPGMGIDLNEQVTIRAGSTPEYFVFDGGLETLLEDTRQRADRKRPFWAKVRLPREG
jgi:predicted esterase